MTPAQLKNLILYEDTDIFVLNKPAGLLVHPVAEDSIALTLYLPMLGDGVQLAHRLDRETSGCLVLGRNPHTLRRLGKQFQKGEIKKTYHALVAGELKGDGVIDAPLAKDNALMIVRGDGVSAITRWRAIEQQDGQRDGMTLVELQPHTGRTHQLRAHMRHLGHPIIGDVKYGGPQASSSEALGHINQRMMLHASAVEIPELSVVTAPLPFN